MSIRWSTSIVTMIAGALALTGCGPVPEPTTTPPPKPVVSSGFVDRIDGSTATIPLGSAVMKALAGTDKGMVFNKTDKAYENLIAKTKDLILVTYPSAEEFQMAKDAGIELEVIPVVKDALIFLANTANPVSGLTSDQIKGIYTGKITRWSEVGGRDSAIIPYQRQVNSGSQTLFLKLAMGDTTPMDAPTDLRPGTMNMLVDVIADYDNSVDALGYSVFYYATEMYLKDNVKLVAINGVTPSAKSISDDSYPYGTNYYAVLRSDTPADSEARQVVNWMLGDAAQQLASRASYIPLDPRNIADPEPDYGYFGSTKENTTQSSGTGGKVPLSVEELSYDKQYRCTTNSDWSATSFTVDGQPAMSAGVMKWIDQHPGSTCPSTVTKDITIVNGDPDGAISASGSVMTLSDFFYDSVNYIDYINHNLFNELTNPEFVDWLRGDPESPGFVPVPPVGFSGLPNDYTSFHLSLDNSGMTMYFVFPDGNPFFASNDTPYGGEAGSTSEVTIGLRLPADLSPFGRIAATTWKTAATGQVYPQVTTTSAPSQTDERLNAKIVAAVGAHPELPLFKLYMGGGRVALVGFTDGTYSTNRWETPGGISLVGQWRYGTWEDDPMSAADLPADWRTNWGGTAGPFSSWVVCPVNRVNDTSCHFVGEDGQTSFSPGALVQSVWSYYTGVVATVIDGDRIFVVGY